MYALTEEQYKLEAEPILRKFLLITIRLTNLSLIMYLDG
jgi:hypothetical protein